jgi:hypothetical protein
MMDIQQSPSKKIKLAQVKIEYLESESQFKPLVISGGALCKDMAVLYRSFEVIGGIPAITLNQKDKNLKRLCGVYLTRSSVIRSIKAVRTRISVGVVMDIGRLHDPVATAIAEQSNKKRAMPQHIATLVKDYQVDLPETVRVDVPRINGGTLPLTVGFSTDATVSVKVMLEESTFGELLAELALGTTPKKPKENMYYEGYPKVIINKSRKGRPYIVYRLENGRPRYHQYKSDDGNVDTASDETKAAICEELMAFFNEHNVCPSESESGSADAVDGAGDE